MKNKQRLSIRQKKRFFHRKIFASYRKTLGKGDHLKSSDQQEVRGVGKVAKEKYMSWTVVIDVFFILNLAAIWKKTYFRFRSLQPNY
jgi:hypothetical protein